MRQLIYLDNGSTSFPKPEEVYTFMDSFYRNYGVNPGRAGYSLCIEAGAFVEETRKLIANLFGGSNPERLCFCYNSTDALNMILFGLLQPGDHVVTTTLEHNAVLRPLHHLARQGVQVDFVPFDGAGFIDPEEVARRFKPHTRVVVLNHGSNVIGTVQPIREVGRRCRERGILLVIDASQTAGVVPIHVEEDFVDVLAFTGHKSLMGPTGIGGLYVREGVCVGITRAGGTGVLSALKAHPEEYPYRFEYGTPNVVGIAGLRAGVSWVLNQGLDRIHQRELELCHLLRDGLRGIEGVRLYCADDLTDHLAVLSFNVEGLPPEAVGAALDREWQVACRPGLHCAPMAHEQLGTLPLGGTVRVSIGPFNTREHIERLVEGVTQIAARRPSGQDCAGAPLSGTCS